MRFLKFILALAATLALLYALETPLQVGERKLPPIGNFVNPFTGFWQNATPNKGYSNQATAIPSLSETIKVAYDDRLVPHIFANNIDDAIFVQGFITAQHRLWQMDISTRSVSGRLAEVLGISLLERDRLQRRKGMLTAAENALKGWRKNPDFYKLIERYSAGVNAYIAQLRPKDYPIEYKLLNYQPEAWTPLHTALFSKAMAESLCLRENDLEASNSLELFGRELFDFIYPEYNPKQSPIIPSEVKWDFKPKTRNFSISDNDSRMGYIPHKAYPKPPPFLGSNNWAVAASKTESGNPILCSDPHLMLTLPAIWFELQIHTPELNAYGVSLPGIPGVIIGFNQDIAWGVTNSGRDVADWYKIKWENVSKRHYLVDGKPKAIKTLIERIKVKGEKTVSDTVKYTIWGPIVHESDNHPNQDMALRWIGHDIPNSDEMTVFLNLNSAKNYKDFANALSKYEAPSQNFVFASKDGDIAIHSSGKYPIKLKEQGRFVQDGSKSKNAWKLSIPISHQPKIKNPTRGYVGSANQNPTDSLYPYYYNGGFDDYRGRFLHRKLAQMDDIILEEMMELQNNNYSLEAEELLPLLLKNIDKKNLDKAQDAILLTLENWDYYFAADKIAPSLYKLWKDEFYELTWDEIYNVKSEMDILMPELWRTIQLLERNPNNRFFDYKLTLDKKEKAADIVQMAFDRATTKAKSLQKEGKLLEWSKYKATQIRHLGRIPAFTYKNVPIGGYHHALNAVQSGAGPSWRMVVELGDEIEAFGIYPGGQSGNPGSKFYDNMIEDWAIGEYHELLFVKDLESLDDQLLYEHVFEPF